MTYIYASAHAGRQVGGKAHRQAVERAAGEWVGQLVGGQVEGGQAEANRRVIRRMECMLTVSNLRYLFVAPTKPANQHPCTDSGGYAKNLVKAY